MSSTSKLPQKESGLFKKIVVSLCMGIVVSQHRCRNMVVMELSDIPIFLL